MGGHSQGQPVLTGAGESGLPRPRRAKWRDCRELPALEAMPTTATARQIAAQRTQAPMASEGLRGPPNPWRRVASFSGMAKQQHTGAVPEPGSCPGSQFHRTGLQSYLKNFFQCQRPKKAWKFVVGIQAFMPRCCFNFFKCIVVTRRIKHTLEKECFPALLIIIMAFRNMQTSQQKIFRNTIKSLGKNINGGGGSPEMLDLNNILRAKSAIGRL